jgi:large subunit ribosomal protein L18
MYTEVNRKAARRRIRYRIRNKIKGSPTCPRLAVFRSLNHIYAQAIDDEQGKTLASASTRDATVRAEVASGSSIKAAEKVGGLIAQRLKDAGVETVVFDRGGFVYHGRVKALAEAARETGLKF